MVSTTTETLKLSDGTAAALIVIVSPSMTRLLWSTLSTAQTTFRGDTAPRLVAKAENVKLEFEHLGTVDDPSMETVEVEVDVSDAVCRVRKLKNAKKKNNRYGYYVLNCLSLTSVGREGEAPRHTANESALVSTLSPTRMVAELLRAIVIVVAVVVVRAVVWRSKWSIIC